MGSHKEVLTLNNGEKMPSVGLGTWLSKPGEVSAAVESAVNVGYRHIDCAWIYSNEAEVGEGLARVFKSGTVKREDLFITSKLWNTFHRHQDVKPALQETLTNLGLEYLDLYLMHWPQSYQEGGDKFPKDENGKFIYSTAGFMDAWKAMEECVEAGLVKSIGLSNFNSKQIQRVCNEGTIKPAVVQVEVHVWHSQKPLVDFCHKMGIVVTAYSPLGNPTRPWAKPEDAKLLEDAELAKIAEKVGRSPAQVLLRYLLQRNIIVIPKSVTPSRIKDNFQLFDFELSEDDMTTLAGFNKNARGCALEWVSDHPDYPFNHTEVEA